MTDIVTKEKRSKMMAGIRAKDTKPEMIVRKALHHVGFRYRLHVKDLPGKPDLVLPKYKAVIFVNGCFWHGHDCHLFKMPSTRREFWKDKIHRNHERDLEVQGRLLESGWRRLIIWECALKGRSKLDFSILIQTVAAWLTEFQLDGEILGGHS